MGLLWRRSDLQVGDIRGGRIRCVVLIRRCLVAVKRLDALLLWQQQLHTLHGILGLVCRADVE